MDEYDFDETYDDGFDSLDDDDKEFLTQGQETMVLQVFNNMGEVDDMHIGYDAIKKFIDGIK